MSRWPQELQAREPHAELRVLAGTARAARNRRQSILLPRSGYAIFDSVVTDVGSITSGTSLINLLRIGGPRVCERYHGPETRLSLAQRVAVYVERGYWYPIRESELLDDCALASSIAALGGPTAFPRWVGCVEYEGAGYILGTRPYPMPVASDSPENLAVGGVLVAYCVTYDERVRTPRGETTFRLGRLDEVDLTAAPGLGRALVDAL